MKIFANYSMEQIRHSGRSVCMAGFMEPVYWCPIESAWLGVFSGGATTFARVVPMMLSEQQYVELLEAVACVPMRTAMTYLRLAKKLELYAPAPDFSVRVKDVLDNFVYCAN